MCIFSLLTAQIYLTLQLKIYKPTRTYGSI